MLTHLPFSPSQARAVMTASARASTRQRPDTIVSHDVHARDILRSARDDSAVYEWSL